MLPMPRCLNYNYSGNGKTTNPMSRYLGPKECNCVAQGSSVLKTTGIGKSTNPRFRENEVKKLRSTACCMQENATFYPLILRTWGL